MQREIQTLTLDILRYTQPYELIKQFQYDIAPYTAIGESCDYAYSLVNKLRSDTRDLLTSTEGSEGIASKDASQHSADNAPYAMHTKNV